MSEHQVAVDPTGPGSSTPEAVPVEPRPGGHTASAGTATADAPCPTCDGGGVRTRCANDGSHGCSHTNDREWICGTCRGEGAATASQRLEAAADLVDDWSQPYASPLAELLRSEAMHAADLEAQSVTWDRYPSDTALLVQIADCVLEADR